MNALDELIGVLALGILAAIFWACCSAQETYSHMPPSARPHLENWAH